MIEAPRLAGKQLEGLKVTMPSDPAGVVIGSYPPGRI